MKEKKQNQKNELLNEIKKTELYRTVIDKFPDAILTGTSDEEESK